MVKDEKIVLESSGYCPTCRRDVRFIATNPWLRDHFLCQGCGSIPRERALMVVLEMHFPNWMNLNIHESSPINRGAGIRIASECSQYIPSRLFDGCSLGDYRNGVRCENLESLTFPDESIDLHITQDVMEHVYNPPLAFREIARTLKPGGAHVFTVPIINKYKPSQVRAKLGASGQVVHLQPPVFHGSDLVTVDWGFDICRHIFDASGLFTHVIFIDDLSKGIRAEYNDVLVTVKPRRDSVHAS